MQYAAYIIAFAAAAGIGNALPQGAPAGGNPAHLLPSGLPSSCTPTGPPPTSRPTGPPPGLPADCSAFFTGPPAGAPTGAAPAKAKRQAAAAGRAGGAGGFPFLPSGLPSSCRPSGPPPTSRPTGPPAGLPADCSSFFTGMPASGAPFPSATPAKVKAKRQVKGAGKATPPAGSAGKAHPTGGFPIPSGIPSSCRPSGPPPTSRPTQLPAGLPADCSSFYTGVPASGTPASGAPFPTPTPAQN